MLTHMSLGQGFPWLAAMAVDRVPCFSHGIIGQRLCLGELDTWPEFGAWGWSSRRQTAHTQSSMGSAPSSSYLSGRRYPHWAPHGHELVWQVLPSTQGSVELVRPKKSPMMAQARGLAVSEAPSRIAKMATCQRWPELLSNISKARAPVIMANALIFAWTIYQLFTPRRG